MKEFHLIRHGAAEEDMGPGNLYSSKAGLSELGVRQVEDLASYYKQRQIVFDKVYSSPLPRAILTAEMLPRKSREIHVVKDLREPNWGKLVGRPFASFPTQAGGRGYDLFLESAGQEKEPSVIKRVRRAIEKIRQTTKSNQKIAIVSHGFPSKIAKDFFEHPNGPVPLYEKDLPESDQLANGEAHILTLNDSDNILWKIRTGGRR